MWVDFKANVYYFITDTENQVLGLKILGWVLIFLAPVKEVLFSVGFLLMTDLVTGIWAALRANKKIRSSTFRQSVTKSASYLTAICTAYVTQTFLINNALPLVHIVAGLIGTTEILSIYENLSKISGVPFSEKIKDLLQPKKNEEKEP